jgi:RNA polymerase sigma-70 factor (ECF subfamily)
MSASSIRSMVEAIWRMESADVIGRLLRITHDVDRAQDLAQSSFLAALETWPRTGIAVNPRAWLMLAARNRGIDSLRREHVARAHSRASGSARSGSLSGGEFEPDLAEDGVGDDVLRLMLVACHPVLPHDGRVALTLRLLGGLTTEEIARAFLELEPTVAQRIVRAKRTLSEARVPFDVPIGDELRRRVPSLLEVVYLIFNEGYVASRGDAWFRPELCEEALRLGRIVCALVPNEPEVLGLLALMELNASRLRARVGSRGEPVPLSEQARARWDYVLINHGLETLRSAKRFGETPGTYLLQAELAACHARAPAAEETDWPRVVALYQALYELNRSPIVRLNQAVAVCMASGPAAGLALVDAIADDPALRGYRYVHGVRGDILQRLGRLDEARAEFERAAALTNNTQERKHLLARARRCAS